MREEPEKASGAGGQAEGDAEVLRTIGAAKKPGRWRWVRRLLVALVVLVGIFAALRWSQARREAAEAPRFQDAEVTRGDLQVTVTATGTIKGLNTVDVGAEVSGRVTRVYVDFNDRVEEGQLLAEIDPEQPLAAVDEASARVAAAEAGIQQAKATLEETRLTLAQAEAQAKEGLISQRDLNTARAAAERAKASLAGANADATLARASLKSARAKLGRTKIISPARGVVLSRQVEPGQTVTAGFETPILFKVAEDLTQMRLHVYVDEADVGRVREGQDATFTVDAFPGRTFPSKVLSLRNEPRTEQNVVSYEALLAVDNKELLLRPGMTATATIITEARKDVLLVPNAALRFAPPAPPSGFGPPTAPQGPEGPRVWVLEGNEPVAVSVTPGPSDGRMTEITGGALQVGQRVLTDVAEVP